MMRLVYLVVLLANKINASNIPTYATPTYCAPPQTCWPTSAWNTLNSSVGGRLTAIRPFASVCYLLDPSYNAIECEAIENGYLNGTIRSEYPGAMQSLNWEECLGQNCWLNSLVPQIPQVLDACYQGRIPAYSVAVTDASDIQASVAFANLYSIKMVIKNTGHEYLGRSSGPGTLQIWTHNLDSIDIIANFTPDGGLTSGPAAVIGAGVQAATLYRRVGAAGYQITLGAFESVGVGGGFAMGGGHGPLAPKYGLAVDNILQYRVVTANGTILVANAAQNTDLYYALRGGGGGSFAIGYEVSYALHPPSEMQVAQINVAPLPPQTSFDDTALADYLTTFASFQTEWSDSGWAGYTWIYPSNMSFTYVLPSDNATLALEQMAPWYAYLAASPDFVVTYQQQVTVPSLAEFVEDVLLPTEPNVPVGYAERLASRLIPRSLFATDDSRASLTSAIIDGININNPTISVQGIANLVKPVAFQIYATTPANQPDNSQTGVNPAWRDALWHVVYANGWVQGVPQDIKDTIANATSAAAQPLRDLTPGGGSYYSEADVLESEWQEAFFGSNYAQLQQIKQKYDPTNVLNVWKGVGWTGAADPAYSCYAEG